MLNTPHCYLTTGDFLYLESIAQRERLAAPFLKILKRKLSSARILFRDELDPSVASIGCYVTFSVNDGAAETRLLVRETWPASPSLALPITTVRGMALLGLTVGGTIASEDEHGNRETLHLVSLHCPAMPH